MPFQEEGLVIPTNLMPPSHPSGNKRHDEVKTSSDDIASALIAYQRRQSKATSKPSGRNRSRRRGPKEGGSPQLDSGAEQPESDHTAPSRSARQALASSDGLRDSGPSRRTRQSSEKGLFPDLRDRPKAESQSRGSCSSRRDRHRHAPTQADHCHATRDGRQLFDPRRHDPVKFASQQRSHASTDKQSKLPAQASSASRDPRFVSAGTPSSLAGPTNSSMPERPPLTAFNLTTHVADIKRVYRNIGAVEAKLQQIHRSEAEKQRDISQLEGHTFDHSYWLKVTSIHRELAELHSVFLEMTLRPDLPDSVQELPQAYSLPARLWQTGFHLMLERLRHNLPTLQDGKLARSGAELLDHLTEFIYFAYSFYTTLLETERFKLFRKSWVESLGDLARYRMAVAGLAASISLNNGQCVRNKQSRQEAEYGRIDDDDEPLADGASIGSAALGDWEFVEKETWRQTARDWYARGLAESPHSGRLHHHLGVLSRAHDLMSLYHFCRSLTTAHPFASAKETVLSLFDQHQQALRLNGDASIQALFIYLHGTLITKVQLDDFDTVFDRLQEKLGGRHSLSQANWMMMASVNLAGLLQYGAEGSVLINSVLRKKEQAPRVILAKAGEGDASDDADEDLSDDALTKAAEAGEEIPITLKYAMKLTFSMLGHSMRSFLATPNPYVTQVLTFVVSVARYRRVYRLLERQFPWKDLLPLLSDLPSISDANLSQVPGECPLPEDWCLRGTSGVGRQTYDRNLFKTSTGSSSLPTFQTEVEVLGSEDMELHERFESSCTTLDELRRRRITFVVHRLSKLTKSIEYHSRSKQFALTRALSVRMRKWKLEDDEEELQNQIRKMSVSKSQGAEEPVSDSESEDDDKEGQSEEVRQLRERRRYLKSVLHSSKAARTAPKGKVKRFQPGETTLILDTNLLVTPGDLLGKLVESKQWTIIIPLTVVTELDGLKRNANALGEEASRAISFLESHIRSHARWLKVQTSRGNFLTDLTIRAEEIGFGEQDQARNVDEVILRAVAATTKAALLTLDKNLRLKAKARGLCSLDESEIADLVVETVERDKGS